MDVKSLSFKGNYDFNVNSTKKDPDVKNVTELINQRLTEKREALHDENAKEISKTDLEKSIENVNKFLEINFTSLKFQVHEDLDRIFVEIVDQVTQEVVREIPPKEFLDMISSMLEHVGLIVDKRI